MSALFSMESVLDPDFLTAEYQKVAKATYQNPLLDYYDTGHSQEPGDLIEMLRFSDDRSAAAVNKPGSPARTQDLNGATKVFFSPVYSFNEITIPIDSITHMRQPGSAAVDEKGAREIMRQFEFMGKRQRMLRAVTLSKALADGVIYYDGDGKILESSSGARTTVDLGVGATHKSQLAHASNGGSDIIGTRWDQTTAKIYDDLRQIEDAAEYDMVPTPTEIWLHPTWKQYLRDNTDFIKFLTYQSSPQADAFIQGMQVDELKVGKYTFHFYNGTYIGADGSTVRPIIPVTKAIITPARNDGTWFRAMNAASPVPSSVELASGVSDGLGKFNMSYGMHSYAAVKHNPPALSVFMGDKFLYAFADPNAVWMPTIAT